MLEIVLIVPAPSPGQFKTFELSKRGLGWRLMVGEIGVSFSALRRREERHLNNVTFHQEIIIARNVDADIWLAGGGTILMK